MATYSPIEIIRNDIERKIKEIAFIAQLGTINRDFNSASINMYGTIEHGAIFLDDVNVSDMESGDMVICVKVFGRSYIVGGISPRSSTRATQKFFGTLSVGSQQYHTRLPYYGMETGSYSLNATSYSYSYGTYTSYDVECSGELYSEDHYAGEIRRYYNDLYLYSSSYSFGSYYSSYNLNWEFVKSDDSRYIQGIPVIDERPEVNEVLMFNEVGGWKPSAIPETVIPETITGNDTTDGEDSTGSTSYTDTSTSVTITFTRTSNVIITAGCVFWSGDSAGGHTAYVALYDGSSTVNERSRTTLSGLPVSTSWNVIRSSLAPGTYTFKIQYKTQSGSSCKVAWASINVVAIPV